MSGGYYRQLRASRSKFRLQGYTIIEVMIFLAISGFMFLLAAIFINGKQAAVEFRQGMQDINSQVEAVINQVSNGEYFSPGNFSCTSSSGTPAQPPTFTTTAAATGSNGSNGVGSSGCIFLGKIVQFDIGGVTTAYDIYSVAGRQFNPKDPTSDALNNVPVASFSDAKPIVIFDYTNKADLLTQHQSLNGGLEFTNGWFCSAACNTPIMAVGFFGSFTGSGDTPGELQAGSQTVITAYIPGATVPSGDELTRLTDPASGLNNTLSGLDSDILSGGKHIVLCFNYGPTKKGSLTIGGSNGQQFTTDVELGAEADPKC